jgi:large subunit ribosomal protein L4e
VSRVPRVKGGGTHRAGQGAFANMCRGGRMFAPTKVWRRWHRKINVNQKRYAVASAVAASSLPALVMARGHRIQTVQELPLVVERDFEKIRKTRACVLALQKLKLGRELTRCKSRYKRAGKGKARNRRFKHRTGPLIVYSSNRGLVQAARNIRGVDLCRVDRLNLLKLCPGGHVGRLIIWTEDAFRRLNSVFGTQKKASPSKSGYHLPRPLMKNSDLNRIINSQEVQSALTPKKRGMRTPRKKNPLKRPELYAHLNPLFEKRYKDTLAKKVPGKALPKTTKLLKPEKKRQRVKIQVTPEQREQMKKYWQLVVGEPIFKTRARLNAEKEAVRAKIAQLEKEKAGLDLLEIAPQET